MRFHFNSHELLKIKLSGSTMLETIVASIIFMIVFGMAMDFLTRILISNHKDNDSLPIESAFNKCQRQMARTEITVGEEIYAFDWGEIQVIVAPYKNELLEVKMNATTRDNRKVSYQYITANKNVRE